MVRLVLGPLLGLLVTVGLVLVLPRRWRHLRAVVAAGVGFGVAVLVLTYA